MIVEQTLKTVIETATSKKLYAIERPETDKECSFYTPIYPNDIVTHSGMADVKQDRIQITVVSETYGTMKSMVAQIKGVLDGNKTDFLSSVPLATGIEGKEDNLYYKIIEYLIQYK